MRMPDAQSEISKALENLGLLPPKMKPEMAPLPGGVSSDIWRVSLPDRTVCKAGACKVEGRSGLAGAGRAQRIRSRLVQGGEGDRPECCARCWRMILRPASLPWSTLIQTSSNYGNPLCWRGELKQTSPGLLVLRWPQSIRAPRMIRKSRLPSKPMRRFMPYASSHLEATAGMHPELSEALFDLSRRTATMKRTLVHGDVSPKNILVGPDGPVFLDAECAWHGDPAFDAAFCLNHLLLKAAWRPCDVAEYLGCYGAFAEEYLNTANWEPRDILESRISTLLPGLFLARVDGKSPVEYLTDENDKNKVRRTARNLLLNPVTRLDEVAAAWKEELTK